MGVWGIRLQKFANGVEGRDVIEEYETKSIGRDVTFEKDLDDENRIVEVLDDLAEDVHEDVVSNALKFKTITVRVRYHILKPILAPNP